MSSNLKQPQLNQHLNTWWDEAVILVSTEAQNLEKNYFNPAWKYAAAFGGRNPAIATFLAVFGLLAFFPISAFLGFTILIFSTFTFIALGLAAAVSLFIIALAAGILLSTLTILAGIALVTSLNTFFALLGWRLVVHLKAAEGSWLGGVKSWLGETRARIGLPTFVGVSGVAVTKGGKAEGKRAAGAYPYGYTAVPRWQEDMKGEESDSTLA